MPVSTQDPAVTEASGRFEREHRVVDLAANAPFQRPILLEDVFINPDEGTSLSRVSLQWFEERGVPIDALASPIAVRQTRILVGPNGRYVPNTMGQAAFILPVLGPEGPIDFCAWVPGSRQLATRLGRGALLGGELVGRDSGDGVTIPPLPVFLTPLQWLRSRRRGVVIINKPKGAHSLSGVVVIARDNEHARELRNLHTPAPIVQVARYGGPL